MQCDIQLKKSHNFSISWAVYRVDWNVVLKCVAHQHEWLEAVSYCFLHRSTRVMWWCLFSLALPLNSGDQVTVCCLQCCVHIVQQAEHCSSSVLIPGCTMAQVFSYRSVTAEAQVQFQASPTWGLWWTKWHWNGFSSQYLSFPLSVSFHHCSILIHSSTTHAI